MIELHYGYSYITQKFVERYPLIDDFIFRISESMKKIDDSGKLAYDIELTANDWKLIYFTVYKLFKNHWFKSTDGELRDLRIADKIYNEYPRTKFERALEQKLITQKDLDGLLTSVSIQNTAQHPATPPSTDSDEILGYIDAQAVGTQKNSIADLVNTSFVNRSARLEKWVAGFKNMFVSIFTTDTAPYFTGTSRVEEVEYDD